MFVRCVCVGASFNYAHLSEEQLCRRSGDDVEAAAAGGDDDDDEDHTTAALNGIFFLCCGQCGKHCTALSPPAGMRAVNESAGVR